MTALRQYPVRHGRYVRVSSDDVPASFRWDVKREDAGQIVEVAHGFYGAAPAGWGDPYRKTLDRSQGPGTETYERYVPDGDLPPVTWEDIPTRIRSLCDRMGISQAKLADALEVPLRTLESWLAGQEPTHPSLILRALRDLERERT